MYETSEKRLNNKITRSPRGRYHFLMTYLPDEEIKRVLEHYRDYIRSALWITHDKDRKDVENDSGSRRLDTLDDNENSELKEVHRHVLLYTYDAHTETAVRKWFYRFRITETKIDDNGNTTQELCSTLNQLVDSVGAARDYLTHENDPDKYHYDKKDVKTFGNGWMAFNCASRCSDDALVIIQRLSNGDCLADMVREYGRDFVYHYKQYREMAVEIGRQQRMANSYSVIATETFLQGTDTLINANDFNHKRQISPEAFNKAVEIINAFEGIITIMKGEL